MRIESMLSARLFLAPQIAGDRLFFISNISGKLSLYAMNYGGSVPEPLLPPHIALQNPELIGGRSFAIFPQLSKILVMIDNNGDEKYQPMLIPMDGGYPAPIFEDILGKSRVYLGDSDREENLVYLVAESTEIAVQESYRANLESGEITHLSGSMYGRFPACHSNDHTKAVLIEGYTVGDEVLYLWEEKQTELKGIYGIPIENRQQGQNIPLSGFFDIQFSPTEQGLLVGTALFNDTFSPGYLDLNKPFEITPVTVTGIRHSGLGEMIGITHLKDDRYLAKFNIDGCSWAYESRFNTKEQRLELEYVLCGSGLLSNGVLESINYDIETDRFILSFSTATSPAQIYTVEGPTRDRFIRHTNEKILGISLELLSAGEDASYTSYDGTRISARLYLPAEKLGFSGPRPVVYYIHGGPQGQERPDFTWFSMPLIQFLTINGFAVFVPNVRGSTGYGLSYTKQVDRDWGGNDRLDHIHAMTEVLPKDSRLDLRRTGVVGRSYGGYMTLTLAGRHPELWSAAVDMFGPYDLLTFLERIPVTWKPYMDMAIGNPADEKDYKMLVERSPKTYLRQLKCPMLVIQGKNDPRVVEQESRDLVEQMRKEGKTIEYLMFENEGHDVLKFENRVNCYNAITDFFKSYLKP